nr:isopentenyl-diphosphate Delta-isomerase [Corynebacterium uropygiale]
MGRNRTSWSGRCAWVTQEFEHRFADGEAEIQVEVVDGEGTVLGTVGKLEAHVPPGILHRAFSLFLFDPDGRMVLQRRAATKYHSPLLLTNATCSHPRPGEPVEDAVRRRAAEELGAHLEELREVGIVVYQVHDERSGLSEHEYNHVFAGRVDASALRPDPEEVDEIVLVTPEELEARRGSEPFTEWFSHVWERVAPVAGEFGFRAGDTPAEG